MMMMRTTMVVTMMVTTTNDDYNGGDADGGDDYNASSAILGCMRPIAICHLHCRDHRQAQVHCMRPALCGKQS